MLSKKKRDKIKEERHIKYKKYKKELVGYERSLKYLKEQRDELEILQGLTETEIKSQLNIIDKKIKLINKNIEYYRNKLEDIS